MYSEIGKKIKGLAKFIGGVGIFIGIVIIIVSIAVGVDEGGDFGTFLLVIGIFTGVIFALISWINVWKLYAYGEIVDKLTEIERNTNVVSRAKDKTNEGKMFVCPGCGSPVYYGEERCKTCGKEFDWSKV